MQARASVAIGLAAIVSVGGSAHPQSAPAMAPPLAASASAQSIGAAPSAAPSVNQAIAAQADRCANGEVDAAIIRGMIASEARRQDADGSAGIGDGRLALAVADQESGFGRSVNSDPGARGPMQLMPATATRYGVSDVCDASENIRGGIAYLKDLMAEFGGNIFLVLAAYNSGEKRVYDAHGVPPIAQTVRYVAAVANAYYGFDNILKGGRRAKGDRTNPARTDMVAAAPVVRASNDAMIHEGSGQKWIGGSVLYVNGDNSQ